MSSFFPRFYFATARTFTILSLINPILSFATPAIATGHGADNNDYSGVFSRTKDSALSTDSTSGGDVPAIVNLMAQFFRSQFQK